MKKIIYLSMLFIGCRHPVEVAYIIIVTGQSNATTYNLDLTDKFTKDISMVRYYGANCNCFLSRSNGGFEMQTGGNFDSNIYTIKEAQASLSIINWADTGFMFKKLQASIKAAFSQLRAQGRIPVVLSTIWLQGESDIQNQNKEYQKQLAHFIDSYINIDPALRKQFVMVKVRQDQTFSENSSDFVNIPFENIARERTYCKVIDPVEIGAQLREDHAHYTAEGYLKIADKWAEIIKDQ